MSRWTLVLLLVCSVGAQAQRLVLDKTEFTTEDIALMDYTDSTCVNYCVVGACVWLRCSFIECEIQTSLRVKHNNPDLVVSMYDIPGNNPWKEAEVFYGDLEKSAADAIVGTFFFPKAGQGHRVEGGSEYADQSLRYYEATAIGHPMSAIADTFSDSGLYCPSEANILEPMFSSGFDAWTWRLGLAEMLYLPYFLPGVRVIGRGLHQQWGPLFPRTGFVLQKDPAKGAAVIAQRVGNIVTQDNQPHVYNPFRGVNFRKIWLPGELKENDKSTGVWQMIAPKADKQCYAFGANDVLGADWSRGRNSEDNRYAFSLWRPYECCKGRGSLIASTDFAPVCL